MRGPRSALLRGAFVVVVGLALSDTGEGQQQGDVPMQGWTPASLRDELRPSFEYEPEGGPESQPAWVIRTDEREGLRGYWTKAFPIEGGRSYRFACLVKSEGVANPRRCALAKIHWLDAEGRLVSGFDGDKARPSYPPDGETRPDGWQEIAKTYLAPKKATQAKIELHLRWAPNGTARFSNIALEPAPAPEARTVGLAAIHFRPRDGKTPAGNCRLFEPFIKKAAEQGADLVCLPECLTMVGNGHTYVQAAESIPGPSTEYFGQLAKEHDLYIVAGLLERIDHQVFNTAALMGPDGALIGTYHKVCLPREEIEGGVSPGDDYPVFETRFGKVGLMICWDVHFPEVARGLSNNGADVIVTPIWGGNPTLAQARAIENQVYLVTSTYSEGEGKMKSGILDRRGAWIAEADRWGQVVTVQVELGAPTYWPWLGDFRERIYRERP